MQQLTLELPNVHCAACRAAIIETLEDLDGIARATVDPRTRRATVVYDPAASDAAAITVALTAAGYPPHAL